jgi:hypothetical protein
MISHKKISQTKYIFLFFLAIIFLTLIISSCATTSKNEKNIGNAQKINTEKKSTVSNNLTVNNIAVSVDNTRFSDDANIRIKANINFRFPAMSNSASAVIEMAKKDSILITITGPFGISVGKLYANPNEFIMNNNLQNTTFTGVPTEKNIMQIANIPLSFTDLMSILRTSTSQNPKNYLYSSELSNKELSLFQIEGFSDEIANEELIADEKSHNEKLYKELVYMDLDNDIVRMERKDFWGQKVIIANFDEHYTVGKYRFAKNLNLSFPTLNGNVEIRISDISIMPQPTTPMRFSKPKSYQERRFFE